MTFPFDTPRFLIPTMTVLIYALFVSSTFSIALSGGLTFLLYVTALVRYATDKDYRAFDMPMLKPFLACLSVICISMTLNFQEWSDWKNLREFSRYLIPFIVWIPLQQMKGQRVLKILWGFLVFIAIYGIIQHYYGVDWFRPEHKQKVTPYAPDFMETGVFHGKGNFSHHLTYAHYLLLAFPMYLSVAWSRELSKIWRCLFFIGGLLMLGGLFFSLGRSAWVGALAAVGVLCLQLPKKWTVGLAASVVMAGSVFWMTSNPGGSFVTYQQEFDSALKARIDSTFTMRHHRDRFFLWESAMVAIQDHFWWGIGIERDAEVMPEYRQQVEEQRQHQFLNRASSGVHNIYLQIWLNVGLMGLLAYLWWWGVVLWGLTKTLWASEETSSFHQQLCWGLLAAFLGFLAGGLFENNLQDGEIQTLLLLLMGWAVALFFNKKTLKTLGKGLTSEELLNSGVIGIWKDRTDIGDSSDYARQLRQQGQRTVTENF